MNARYDIIQQQYQIISFAVRHKNIQQDNANDPFFPDLSTQQPGPRGRRGAGPSPVVPAGPRAAPLADRARPVPRVPVHGATSKARSQLCSSSKIPRDSVSFKTSSFICLLLRSELRILFAFKVIKHRARVHCHSNAIENLNTPSLPFRAL